MKDNPTKGIVMMAIAIFMIVLMNMFAKLAGDLHAPIEIVFWRSLIALAIVVAIILYSRDLSLFKTQRLKAQMLRSITGVVGLLFVFWSYQLMPMADVVAVMFTAGLMTTAVSVIWLKEKVGYARWGAVAIGFIGALITVSPSGEAWNPHGITVALCAAFIGGSMVSTMLRSLGSTESALTTVFYLTMVGTVLTAPYTLIFGTLPAGDDVLWMLGCGMTGGISLIIKSQAFRYAEASLLSPVHYTAIIWATLLGWVVWNDIPTINILIGAGIIVASNVFILIREKKAASRINTNSNQTT